MRRTRTTTSGRKGKAPAALASSKRAPSCRVATTRRTVSDTESAATKQSAGQFFAASAASGAAAGGGGAGAGGSDGGPGAERACATPPQSKPVAMTRGTPRPASCCSAWRAAAGSKRAVNSERARVPAAGAVNTTSGAAADSAPLPESTVPRVPAAASADATRRSIGCVLKSQGGAIATREVGGEFGCHFSTRSRSFRHMPATQT